MTSDPRDRFDVSIDRVVAGPDDLAVQLPLVARVLRTVPGPDRPDYSIAALRRPLRLRSTVDLLTAAGVDLSGVDPRTTSVLDDGSVVGQVYGLVFAPRTAGVVLAEVRQWGGSVEVATALVLDPSQMSDRSLRLEKIFYAAVTSVTVGSAA